MGPGTQATCSAQGFFLQIGYGGIPLFNVILSAYYLMTVRYNWREPQFQNIQTYVVGSTWALIILLAVLPLFFGLYNNLYSICWISASPLDCTESWEGGDSEPDCVRGDNATIWSYVYNIFPTWLCVLLNILLMLALYSTVRNIETQGTRNVMTSPHGTGQQVQINAVNRSKSNMVAVQSTLYTLAFLVVYIPDMIYSILVGSLDMWNPGFEMFISIIFPLQGFLNFLIFLRRRENMHSTLGRAVRNILCCGGCCGSSGGQNPRSESWWFRITTTTAPLSSRLSRAMMRRSTKKQSAASTASTPFSAPFTKAAAAAAVQPPPPPASKTQEQHALLACRKVEEGEEEEEVSTKSFVGSEESQSPTDQQEPRTSDHQTPLQQQPPQVAQPSTVVAGSDDDEALVVEAKRSGN